MCLRLTLKPDRSDYTTLHMLLSMILFFGLFPQPFWNHAKYVSALYNSYSITYTSQSSKTSVFQHSITVTVRHKGVNCLRSLPSRWTDQQRRQAAKEGLGYRLVFTGRLVIHLKKMVTRASNFFARERGDLTSCFSCNSRSEHWCCLMLCS
jgi:hypothetical protein